MLIALASIRGFQYIFDILKDVKDVPMVNLNEVNTGRVAFHESIEFKNIGFRYPKMSKNSLSDISFSIKKGERIGIIGSSGSGKTTLIHVFLRFLRETSGKIVVDGREMDESQDIPLRNLIGYVKQSVFIIDGSFYDNIAFGIPEGQIDKVKFDRAVKLSCLDEVVGQLEKGADTMIGENGTKLSGGQRQRVAIARALYKEAEILVFDEATSALDSQTEQMITNSIDSLAGENVTMLIIAHRITTLRNCNRIYEIKDGKIVGEYTYQELLNSLH
jgi:ABC-type multidrug transport system fused ATPase/permease subunit